MSEKPRSRLKTWFRRGALAVAGWAVLSSIVALTVPDVPVGGVRTSAAEGMMVGAYHMHTVASDGSGTVDDLVDAALTHGLDFIVVTDHNTLEPTRYEYRRGVLVVYGEEFTTVWGHAVMLDMESVRVSEADSLDRRRGLRIHRTPDDAGLRIVAHPNGRRYWRDRTLGNMDGIELWNADSEWRNDGVLDWMEALTLLPLRPSMAMLALVDRPDKNLALLDSASMNKTLTTACAVDAHARIRLNRERFIPFPTYEMTLGLVHQHVRLAEATTGDAEVDGPRLIEAIRAGGGHCAIGGVADDGGVRIEQTDDGITVTAPADVSGVRIRVVRNGEVVAEEETHTLTVATDEPGMYRVEVDVEVRLVRKRWIPWILSAPLWVGPRPDDPPAFMLGEFEDDYGNRHTITPEVWIQEPGVRYEVDWWFGSQQFVVARNGAENVDAGLWTRIDWMELGDGGSADGAAQATAPGEATAADGDWTWAFCLAEWQGESRSDARRAGVADRSTPRTGCGGFPFSRMRRVR